MPVKISRVFQRLIDDLVAQAQPLALTGEMPSKWSLEILSQSAGRLDSIDMSEVEIHKLFDREELDKAIQEAYDKASKRVEPMLAQVQSDWVASVEKASLARHRTRIRTQIYESLRRRAHADPNGTLVQGPLQHVKQMSEQGFEPDVT